MYVWQLDKLYQKYLLFYFLYFICIICFHFLKFIQFIILYLKKWSFTKWFNSKHAKKGRKNVGHADGSMVSVFSSWIIKWGTKEKECGAGAEGANNFPFSDSIKANACNLGDLSIKTVAHHQINLKKALAWLF